MTSLKDLTYKEQQNLKVDNQCFPVNISVETALQSNVGGKAKQQLGIQYMYLQLNMALKNLEKEGIMTKTQCQQVSARIQNMDNLIYMNPYSLLMGYSILTQDSLAIDKKKYDTCVKFLKNIPNYNIYPEDLIRYSRMWINIKKKYIGQPYIEQDNDDFNLDLESDDDSEDLFSDEESFLNSKPKQTQQSTNYGYQDEEDMFDEYLEYQDFNDNW